mgnify:CR=1 FL=1
MLYIYYGTDIEKARGKVRATIEGMLAKNPDALSLRVTLENFEDFDLTELVQAQALFKNEYIVLLDNLLAEEVSQDVVTQFLKEIAESSNIFFLLEEKIDAKTLKKLEKVAKKVQYFELKAQSSKLKASFNTFSLADAFGEKNKKKLWTLYSKAKFAGVSDEEIHGVLFWMAKSMLLAVNASAAHSTSSGQASEAGMKPFVFNKAKRFASNRGREELVNLVNELVVLPHESRRKSLPLAISLEKFILSC